MSPNDATALNDTMKRSEELSGGFLFFPRPEIPPAAEDEMVTPGNDGMKDGSNGMGWNCVAS